MINQTQHQKSRLRRNYKKEGIILPSYFPPPTEAGEKEKIVLWLANPSPGKQPNLFLDLAQHCSIEEDWRFVLGGEIPDTDYGRQLAGRVPRLSNVDSVGNVSFDKSNEWYASASLFVNTSLPEADGLPNAFIQAWYNGAVVLSLYHDPNGWITKERLGFCANDDFDALVANTIELMNNPAELKQMSDRCRAFAYETFAREEIVQSYSDIFFNKCQ